MSPLKPRRDDFEAMVRGTIIRQGRNQALSRVDTHAVDGTRESLCATGLVTSCWVTLPA